MCAGSGDDLIKRCFYAPRRGELLKGGFGMLRRAPLARQVGLPQLEDEALCDIEAAVDEQGADQRFDDVPDDVLALACPVLARLFAEPDERWNADLAPVLGAGFAVDECIVALREIALRLLGVALVEGMRHDHAEHAVAEKFEAFVVAARRARMRKGQFEEANVVRLMVKPVAN